MTTDGHLARREASREGRTAETGHGGLHAIVGCHSFLCAIPTHSIVRLMLAAEATPSDGVLAVDGVHYAVWDLGQLLELPPLGDAWILLSVPAGSQRIKVALRTGPCLSVQLIEHFVDLPSVLFRSRRKALTAVFPGSSVKGRGGDKFLGFCLDPSHTWTFAELEQSAKLIARADAARPA